jgi:hypothetical protein
LAILFQKKEAKLKYSLLFLFSHFGDRIFLDYYYYYYFHFGNIFHPKKKPIAAG